MANSKAKNKNRIAKIIATIIIIITIIVFHLAIKYVAYPVAGFFLFGGISKGEVLHITVKEPLTYDELNTNYSGTADWFSNVNSLSVYQLKKYMKKNDKQIEPGLYFIEPYCYYETLLAELSFSDVLEEDRVLTE